MSTRSEKIAELQARLDDLEGQAVRASSKVERAQMDVTNAQAWADDTALEITRLREEMVLLLEEPLEGTLVQTENIIQVPIAEGQME